MSTVARAHCVRSRDPCSHSRVVSILAANTAPLRLPPRGDSQLCQRPKRLPHVVEFTKRRVELFARSCLPSAPDTTTPIHEEQKNAGDR